MGIFVKGARELEQALTSASGKLDKETITVLRREAVAVRRKQKAAAPVEDGDLRKSISYQIRGTKWRRVAEIGPKLSEKYPLYQELGTARMAANPYVGPSLDGSDERLADGLDGIVDRTLK